MTVISLIWRQVMTFQLLLAVIDLMIPIRFFHLEAISMDSWVSEKSDISEM